MSPLKISVNVGDPLLKSLFVMIKEDVGLMPVLEAGKALVRGGSFAEREGRQAG